MNEIEERLYNAMREHGEYWRLQGLAQGLQVAEKIADKMTIRVPGKRAQELVDYAHKIAVAELDTARAGMAQDTRREAGEAG